MDVVIRQFEVYLVTLDPTKGNEIRKTRPCIVASPNEMNNSLNTVFMIPLTSTIRNYPTRVNCTFNGKHGQAVIDQMRAVDKLRLIKKIGAINDRTVIEDVMNILQEIFTL